MKYAGAEQTAGRTHENRIFSGPEEVQEVCCSIQYNNRQNKGRVHTLYILYIMLQFLLPVLVGGWKAQTKQGNSLCKFSRHAVKQSTSKITQCFSQKHTEVPVCVTVNQGAPAELYFMYVHKILPQVVSNW